MKRWIFLLLTIALTGCTELIDPPKNLVPKDAMAELIAEFAINENLGSITENANLDNATRYALQQKKIKGQDFSDSFKYYVASGDMDAILTRAQKIVLDKNPKAKEYIEKQLKEDRNVPVFER